jgi:iron complex transport system permease protein
METRGTSLNRYRREETMKGVLIASSMVLLAAAALIALSLGPSTMTAEQALAAFVREGEQNHEIVMWHIRVPRALTAILAGMGLGVAGAAMQSILRNPLGSPYTLGISQTAAFGAALSIIVLGAGTVGSSMSDAVTVRAGYMVIASAFLFSLLATAVIFLLARYRRVSPESMILTGVALGSLATAGIAALEYFADEVELASIIFWTFGDAGRPTWGEIPIVAGVVIAGYLFLSFNSLSLNALDSGEQPARSLGVNVERLRLFTLVVSSLVTAGIISFVGVIGFVGLVVPHIGRKIIGGDNRFLIPFSAVLGALLILCVDTAARTVISPIVMPVGILTAFIGAPLFIYLVVKGREFW